MAKGKGFEMILKLKAQLDKTLPKSMQEIGKQFSNLNKRQKELNAVSKLLPKNLQKNKAEYQDISNKLKLLNKIKKSTNGLSVEQEKDYKQLTKSHEKLSKTVEKERTAFKRYELQLLKLKIPHDKLQDEIKSTGKELEKVTKKQELFNKAANFKKKAGNLGKKALVAGGKAVAGAAIAGTLATGYFGADSANQFMNFEGQLKRVQAISGSTREEYKLLEKEALNLGATTSFTAQQAAEGMEKFALAGFKVKSIISAMPGMLNLAAASGEDLALVSDIVSDNMTAFKLSAEDAGKVADIFAYTMSKTNTGVGMLGEAFKYIAPSAAGLNVSLEETSSLLGLLADKGIKGSQAGTGLSAMYTKILKEGKEFERLGINVKGGDGNFVGTDTFLAQLDTMFKKEKMDAMERQTFLVNAFGDQGYRVVQSLLDGEKEIGGVTYAGVDRVTAQIEATAKESIGAADKMKDITLEGASGARILFLSAFNGLQLSIGSLIFTEGMISNIKTATKYIGEFGLVLRGELSDDPVNKFIHNILEKIKKIYESFKAILLPGFESLKNILTDPTMVKFFKDIGKALLLVGYIAAIVFSKVAKGLEFLNDTIGLDNILVFVGAFVALTYIVPLIMGIVTKFKVLLAIIKVIPLTLAGLKIAFSMVFGVIKGLLLALGAPIVWIGAAIVGVLYLFHKFGGIKENFLGIWEALKSLGSVIWEIGKTFFLLFTPIGQVISLAKVFYDSWDSSVGIVENLKNVFLNMFQLIPQKFDEILEKIKNFGGKIIEIPIVGKLLEKLNIGVDGSHRNGLANVPYDGYIAELHKGERVLTAEENSSYGERFLGDLKTTRQESIFSQNNTSSSSVAQITIGDIIIQIEKIVTNDSQEIARIIAEEVAKVKDKLMKDIKRELKDANRTAI